MLALAFPAGAPAAPNIVVVTVDDMPMSAFNSRTMPNTLQLLGGQGTTFTNSIVTTPLCCPSRASLLTGQYGHNNGVLSNVPGYGALRSPENILPAWLQEADYNTAHVGKYLNNYTETVDGSTVAPAGWDEWYTYLGPFGTLGGAYYNYDLAVNGQLVHYGSADGAYLGRVLNNKAASLVRTYAAKPEPFYLHVDHLTPHFGAGDKTGRCPDGPVPDPNDTQLFSTEPLPKPPSFNEADVSDKPSFIRRQPVLSSSKISAITKQYRCVMASLRTADRGVKRIWDELQAAGELDNTVIVFTNDNGFYYGQHRIPNGKKFPYEEAIRVPLLIRLPPALNGGTPAVKTVGQPVANIDIAPTLVDFAGASTGRVMDGRSLDGLLRGQAANWPHDRALLIELGVPPEVPPCERTYQGVRVHGDVYIENFVYSGSSGTCVRRTEREHYRLGSDSYQLRNLYPTSDPALRLAQDALASRLDALRECSGIAGRDPLSPGSSHCE